MGHAKTIADHAVLALQELANNSRDLHVDIFTTELRLTLKYYVLAMTGDFKLSDDVWEVWKTQHPMGWPTATYAKELEPFIKNTVMPKIDRHANETPKWYTNLEFTQGAEGPILVGVGYHACRGEDMMTETGQGWMTVAEGRNWATDPQGGRKYFEQTPTGGVGRPRTPGWGALSVGDYATLRSWHSTPGWPEDSPFQIHAILIETGATWVVWYDNLSPERGRFRALVTDVQGLEHGQPEE